MNAPTFLHHLTIECFKGGILPFRGLITRGLTLRAYALSKHGIDLIAILERCSKIEVSFRKRIHKNSIGSISNHRTARRVSCAETVRDLRELINQSVWANAVVDYRDRAFYDPVAGCGESETRTA